MGDMNQPTQGRRLSIIVDFDEPADLTDELFAQMRTKALAQLGRPPALCEAPEAADVLRRPDGTVIGKVDVTDQRPWQVASRRVRLTNKTRFGFSWFFASTAARAGSVSPDDWDRVPMVRNIGWRQLLETRLACERMAGKRLRCVVFLDSGKLRVKTAELGDPIAVSTAVTAATAPTSDMQLVEVERVPG